MVLNISTRADGRQDISGVIDNHTELEVVANAMDRKVHNDYGQPLGENEWAQVVSLFEYNSAQRTTFHTFVGIGSWVWIQPHGDTVTTAVVSGTEGSTAG